MKIGEMIREKIVQDGQFAGYAFEGRTQLEWLPAFQVHRNQATGDPDIFRRYLVRRLRAGRASEQIGTMWASGADRDGRDTYDLKITGKLGPILVRATEILPDLFALHMIAAAEGI